MWTRLWTFVFHKRQGISWLAEWLLASQRLCSMEFVSQCWIFLILCTGKWRLLCFSLSDNLTCWLLPCMLAPLIRLSAWNVGRGLMPCVKCNQWTHSAIAFTASATRRVSAHGLHSPHVHIFIQDAARWNRVWKWTWKKAVSPWEEGKVPVLN